MATRASRTTRRSWRGRSAATELRANPYPWDVPDSVPTGKLMAIALEQARAEPIFTLNGAHIWGLYLGAEQHGLRLVDVRHEQTAGFAAEGWAKVTRRCGVAALTAGPGVTNALSAIA